MERCTRVKACCNLRAPTTHLRRSLASATRRSISARFSASCRARSASSASRLALSASFLACVCVLGGGRAVGRHSTHTTV
jgi:hypothetical protein